ncbi:MAG: hypothetical protein ACFN4V_08660, partial [Prevotella denticola]
GIAALAFVIALFYNTPGKNIFLNFGSGLWAKLPELKRSSLTQKTADQSNNYTSGNNSVTEYCTIVTYTKTR